MQCVQKLQRSFRSAIKLPPARIEPTAGQLDVGYTHVHKGAASEDASVVLITVEGYGLVLKRLSDKPCHRVLYLYAPDPLVSTFVETTVPAG
jgi:hypothetical protein